MGDAESRLAGRHPVPRFLTGTAAPCCRRCRVGGKLLFRLSDTIKGDMRDRYNGNIRIQLPRHPLPKPAAKLFITEIRFGLNYQCKQHFFLPTPVVTLRMSESPACAFATGASALCFSHRVQFLFKCPALPA